jgi:hypothetical protein
MRETINTYASQVPEMWELPVYTPLPPTTTEEEANAQQLWQEIVEQERDEDDEMIRPSQGLIAVPWWHGCGLTFDRGTNYRISMRCFISEPPYGPHG